MVAIQGLWYNEDGTCDHLANSSYNNYKEVYTVGGRIFDRKTRVELTLKPVRTYFELVGWSDEEGYGDIYLLDANSALDLIQAMCTDTP